MKILFFDLETSPIASFNWGIYEQNAIGIIEDWYLLCFAYKWQGKGVRVLGLKNGRKSEKELVTELWKLFNEADVVIAHNAKKFDVKKSNAKFLEYGLKPPSPYKVVDTLQIARTKFANTSNKLDDLGALLGVGRKVKHPGFEMWKGYMNQEPKWIKLMHRYNKQDVVLLEKVYDKLLPWIDKHPNYQWQLKEKGELCCPNCGSKKYNNRGTEMRLNYIIERKSCNECGKNFYGKKTKKPAYAHA